MGFSHIRGKASALGFHTRADTRYKSPHRHERPADGKPGPYGLAELLADP